jgi:hypothetical protein
MQLSRTPKSMSVGYALSVEHCTADRICSFALVNSWYRVPNNAFKHVCQPVDIVWQARRIDQISSTRFLPPSKRTQVQTVDQ